MPVLDLLPGPPEDIYVLELSSYQLDLTEHLSCDVAVISNLTPGPSRPSWRHERLRRGPSGASSTTSGRPTAAVIGVDDAHGRDAVRPAPTGCRRRVLPIAVGRSLDHGVFVLDGRLYDALEAAADPVVDLRPIAQPARHAQLAERGRGLCRGARCSASNAETAAAGLAGSRAWRTAWRRSAGSGGVQFVNDSKATNADAAASALACFERDLLDRRRPAQGRRPRACCRPARASATPILIGEAAAAFEQAFGARVRCTRCGELETAVAQAAADAAAASPRAGAVVLLSPACASFDQFADFEARGEAFKALVASSSPPLADGGRAARMEAGDDPPRRTHRGLLGRWWWTVDRWTWSVSACSRSSASCSCSRPARRSPRVSACRRSISSPGRAMYLLPARCLLLGGSLLAPARRASSRRSGCWPSSSVLMVAHLLFGPEIKGARRWLPIGGLVVQPSEFMKPALVDRGRRAARQGRRPAQRAPGPAPDRARPGARSAEPAGRRHGDDGRVPVGLQLFLAGLPWLLGDRRGGRRRRLGLVGAYLFFPHVTAAHRPVPRSERGDHFQVGTRSRRSRGRPVRQRPGRGQGQDRAARRPHRLHLRGVAEEYGLVACLALRRPVRLRRDARLRAAGARARPLRRCWRPPACSRSSACRR